MRLQEQEQHLLLVEGGVLHIAYRIVMLDCALIQFDEFGELHAALVDLELLHDDILLEVGRQVPLVLSELPQALGLGEGAARDERLGVRP